jgi:hypothetical protein
VRTVDEIVEAGGYSEVGIERLKLVLPLYITLGDPYVDDVAKRDAIVALGEVARMEKYSVDQAGESFAEMGRSVAEELDTTTVDPYQTPPPRRFHGKPDPPPFLP